MRGQRARAGTYVWGGRHVEDHGDQYAVLGGEDRRSEDPGRRVPFGHILGQPRNKEEIMRFIRQALDGLETAQIPGTIVHFQEKWPASHEDALRCSHPETPPPIAADMGRYIGSFLRGLRRGKR